MVRVFVLRVSSRLLHRLSHLHAVFCSHPSMQHNIKLSGRIRPVCEVQLLQWMLSLLFIAGLSRGEDMYTLDMTTKKVLKLSTASKM